MAEWYDDNEEWQWDEVDCKEIPQGDNSVMIIISYKATIPPSKKVLEMQIDVYNKKDGDVNFVENLVFKPRFYKRHMQTLVEKYETYGKWE